MAPSLSGGDARALPFLAEGYCNRFWRYCQRGTQTNKRLTPRFFYGRMDRTGKGGAAMSEKTIIPFLHECHFHGGLIR